MEFWHIAILGLLWIFAAWFWRDDPRVGWHSVAYFGQLFVAAFSFIKDIFLIIVTFGRYTPSVRPDKEYSRVTYFMIGAIIIMIVLGLRHWHY